MLTASKILEALPIDSSIEIKKVEKILKLTKKSEKEKLNIAIDALSKIGIIYIEENGEIRIDQSGNLIEARLRCSNKGYCFAVQDNGGDDIYIRDNNLNHAWNGDRVLVNVSREAVRRRSAEGIVQCILERSTRKLLATIEKEGDKLYANPLDDRILSTIELDCKDDKLFKEHTKELLYEIGIDKYPIAQYSAYGHVIRPLPLDQGIKGDREILMTKNNINIDRNIPTFSVKSNVVKERRDLTNQTAILVTGLEGDNSPPTPAFHIEPKNGGLVLWVHAPEVGDKFKLNSSIDKWLREKSQAFCLGDLWSEFLPKQLIEASKFSIGVRNDAISLMLEISEDGTVIDWEFLLTSIKPVAEISAKQFKAIGTRKPNAKTVPIILKPIKEYIPKVQSLIYCASKLLDQERSKGLIELDLGIDNVENIGDLSYEIPGSELEQWKLPFDKTSAQSVVNILLRVSNNTWYNHLRSFNLPGIVLEASSIDASVLNDVTKSALALDIKLELNEHGVASIKELTKGFSKTTIKRVLDKMIRHAIPRPVLKLNKINPEIKKAPTEDVDVNSYTSQAPWCCGGLHYYEIINQSILVTFLKEGKIKPKTRLKEEAHVGKKGSWEDTEVQTISENIYSTVNSIYNERTIQKLNDTRRKSRALKYGLISMAQCRETEQLIGTETEAIISGVQSYGFFAEILPSMAEGLVHVSSLSDDWYEYRSRQCKLIGRKNKKSYQLGDSIRVKVIKLDLLRNQIDLEISEDNVNTNNANDDNSAEEGDNQK